MKNYIIIWRINIADELGGGLYYELIETEQKLESKANEIMQNEDASIEFAADIRDEISFEPVETVTKWKIKE